MSPVLASAPGRATARATFPGWHPHLDVWLVVLLLGAGYLVATRRDRPSPRQAGAFALGLVTLWVASDWPVHDLSEGYLYSVHMVQHLLYTLVAALLLLLGTPASLTRRALGVPVAGRVLRGMMRPVPALIQFNVILVLSHWPVWVDLTLRHHGVHFVAHVLLIASGLLMWAPVVETVPDVAPIPPPAKMLYLFLQSILPTVPASFLTFGTKPLYHFYETVPRLWGWSALSDQQVAGLIMKILGGMYLWLMIAVIFFRWYAREGDGPDRVLTWDEVERELQQLS